MKGKSNSDTTI